MPTPWAAGTARSAGGAARLRRCRVPVSACLLRQAGQRSRPPPLALPVAGRACSGGAQAAGGQQQAVKAVLITGFESFNVDLYKKAAVALARACPGISLRVFSDRDLGAPGGAVGRLWAGLCALHTSAGLRAVPLPAALCVGSHCHASMSPLPAPYLSCPAGPRRGEVEAALAGADVAFCSLLFDYDQVGWRSRSCLQPGCLQAWVPAPGSRPAPAVQPRPLLAPCCCSLRPTPAAQLPPPAPPPPAGGVAQGPAGAGAGAPGV